LIPKRTEFGQIAPNLNYAAANVLTPDAILNCFNTVMAAVLQYWQIKITFGSQLFFFTLKKYSWQGN
jgi:hypothetical protein